MDIVGKTIVVTGANRGLGHVLAFACAKAGAGEVIAGARKLEDLERLKREAVTTGLRVTPIKLDVTSERDAATVAELDRVDVLINNAGFAGFGNPLTVSFEQIRNEVEVNYLGALLMARAVAPIMIKQREGMIVNVATIMAKANLPIVGTYCATKAALLSLGQALRAYLTDEGVRVVTVLPSTIDTDMSAGADVPKLTKEFVAAEILRVIRDEVIDPPIGEEAQGLYEALMKDPLGVEKMLAQIRA